VLTCHSPTSIDKVRCFIFFFWHVSAGAAAQATTKARPAGAYIE